MSNEPLSISELDLHAYVDDQLDPQRRVLVESYLAENPEAAEKVRAYRQQNEALHALFDPVLTEQPISLVVNRNTSRFRFPHYSAIAATLVMGVFGGWMAGSMTHAERTKTLYVSTDLPHMAAMAHVVYTPEVLHPVEVGADQEEHLTKWLSKRLGTPVRAPHLQAAGFKLEGGRLLPGAQGPAAQFMYQNNEGRRLTLYLRSDLQNTEESSFRYAKEGNVSVFYWVDGPLACALSGDFEREQLLTLAQTAYHDLNR